MKNNIAFAPLVFVLCIGFLSSGCGPRGIPVEVVDSSPKASIKQALASTLESGTLGSEEILIEENLTRLASDDATLGAEIRKLFEDLKVAKTPTAVKAKAKNIIGKL